MVKSSQSVKKTMGHKSSEFQVIKGYKSKSASCQFGVKISNRFEVLQNDEVIENSSTDQLEATLNDIIQVDILSLTSQLDPK